MNIFIKESLYLLDYNDNILDVLFLSTDKDTPGQAYEINIKENNTGYSDLTFKMPSFIVNEEGEKIINPKLTLIEGKRISAGKLKNDGLVPLSKVRYNRIVRYMGEKDEPINYPGPAIINDDGTETPTTVTYPKNDGENPEDYIIEDYTMDYIIQPLDKSKQSLKIDLTYTAIDFPRFNLSKKKLGFTTDQNTLTTAELSLWGNTPSSVPGKVQYIPWTEALATQFQSSNSVGTVKMLQSVKKPNKGEVYYVTTDTVDGTKGYYQYNGETWVQKTTADFVTWEPNAQSGGYPLDNNSIAKLISQTIFTNGILATIFYWPVKMPTYTDEHGIEKERKSARFEGVTYEKGSFITLTLYNVYEGIELKWDNEQKVGNVAWDWSYLEPNQLYLNPNNACNLLRYIVQNTNWSVANDGGALFLAKPNSPNAPWYNENDTEPTTGENGQYYIIRKEEPAGSIRAATYIVKEFQGGQAEDATKKLLSIINTDETDPSHFGIKYNVDVEQVKVSRTADGTDSTNGRTETMDAQYSLNISNANCYNAITSMAKLFDLYPIFDCINKTVSLKKHVGSDYGLVYRAGRNLKTSNIKLDGEKVITKLYVTGGNDSQGSANINIGEAIRVIEGVTPELTTNNLQQYINDPTIKQSMVNLESKAGELITGATITNNLNLNNKELVLSFPDNFYTHLFNSDNDKLNDITPQLLMATNKNGQPWNLYLRYRATDNTHCFYIYFSNIDEASNPGSNACLDEKKQIYKVDCTNIAVRRNLSVYIDTRLGTVSTIPGVRQINGYTDNYANYIKYRDQIVDGAEVGNNTNNYMYKVGVGYKGYNLTLDSNGYYKVDAPFDTANSFVLAGPTRVYEFVGTFNNSNHLTQIDTQLFTPGNYYYITNNNTTLYYYCILQNELQTYDSSAPYYNDSIYSRMNTIAIGNYVFIYLGNGDNNLYIYNNNQSYTVKDIDGNTIKLKDWLVNNYAIRVQVSDIETNVLQQVYDENGFNPNAPEYLIGRSPYGTSYIYNFKYLYDNEWMSEDDILDIYSVNNEINTININFFNKYNQALANARKAYWDAINNLELFESKGDAQLETLMSQYWKNPDKANEDKFSAFPYMPNIAHTEVPAKHMYAANITYEGDIVKTIYFNVYNSNGDQPDNYCTYLYPNSHTFPANAANPQTEGQYHVVAKALGWNNYSKGVLPLDETFTTPTNTIDPSDTISNYNKIINNMKLYYWKAKQAGEIMESALDEVEALEALYDEWQDSLTEKERYLQEHYGQYIIEGSYNNTEQPYANLLLDDGLQASAEYAIPKVTYNVGVIDANGLIEYRAPQLLIANEIVKKLHGLGQVVPVVGDYVSIYDDEMGIVKGKGLITAITRRIDDPYQNAITIDTAYSDADELVGQIITATNTILNNKDIYNRAGTLGRNGELSTDAVNDALSTGKNSLSITSTNGKVVVDDNGLTATNPEDDQKLMRYNGTGVLGSSNGGITWRSLMTQDGINANYIDAGTINTQKVSITDGQYSMVFLDGNGLVVKQGNQNGTANPSLPTGGIGGAYNYKIGYIDNNTLEPVDFSNVSVYIGKDSNGEGIGYFSGYINANKGGNIAGWKLSTTALWKNGTKDNPCYYVGSSPLYTNIDGDVDANNNKIYRNYILKFGYLNNGTMVNHFGITNTGDLIASGSLHIIGNDQGTSTIGPWTITDKSYYNKKSELSDSTDGVYLGIDGIALGANNVFKVTSAGALTSKSGTIGGWTIDSNSLHTNNNNYYLGTTGITAKIGNTNRSDLIFKAGSNFGVQKDGSLFATDGVIGGWSINDSTLTNGKTTLGSGGLKWVNGSSFFAAGVGSNEPVGSKFSAKGFYIYHDVTTTGSPSNISTGEIGIVNGRLDILGNKKGTDDYGVVVRSSAGIVLRNTGGSGNKSIRVYKNGIGFVGAIHPSNEDNVVAVDNYTLHIKASGNYADFAMKIVNGIIVSLVPEE